MLHSTPEKFENGDFTLKTHQMFTFRTTPQQSLVILDLCSRKSRAGKSPHDYRDVIDCDVKASFPKCFPSTLERKAGVFKFLRFEERFRKAPFSRQSSVDSRPNLRKKLRF